MSRDFVKLLVFLLVSWTALAEDTPVEHALIFPKGDLAWTVTFKDAKSGSAGDKAMQDSRAIARVEIVRIGDLRRDTVTLKNGSSTVYWWPKSTPVVLWQEGQAPYRGMKSGLFQDQRYDETLFDWVGKNTFRGTETLEGKPCRIYRREITDEEGVRHVLQAWIDHQNSKPVAWTDGGRLLIFSFDEKAPAGPLVLPDQAREILVRCQAALAPPKRLGKESSR